MKVVYNPFFDNVSIDENVEEKLQLLTGIDSLKWKQLIGFFSNSPTDFISANDIDINGVYKEFRISCSKLMMDVRVFIPMKELHVEGMYLEQSFRKKGHCTKAHNHMVSIASDLGFKFIRGRARGGRHEPDDFFNGHITWAKLGYTMSNDAQFIDEMKALKKSKSCLQKLLNGSANEKEWESNGFAWDAEFDLSENSLNKRILAKYNRRKAKV